MNLQDEITSILSQSEGETLEFKAVLPPSCIIGKILCAFANAKGGHLVLGVAETNGSPRIVGLSTDFHADSVTKNAIELLSPRPVVFHQYVQYGGMPLYVIKVEACEDQVSSKGQVFQRINDRVVELETTPKVTFREAGYGGVKDLSLKLKSYNNGTGAKSKFVEHFQSVLRIIDDLEMLLYPRSPTTLPISREGKILARILFSSSADTFESYFSDLLYEIYPANPNTLKSN